MSETAWETSKENIQPLSGGRKMASLTYSLQRNDPAADLDEETLNKIEKLELKTVNYEGSDPIEPWVEYICFLEQHRLNENTKFSFKYKHAILQCIKTFMMMPVYQNDKRLVEIYLKSISGLSFGRRISLLKNVMSRGIGKTVAKTYLSLAEFYEGCSEFNMALETVRDGLKQNAEPREPLEDYCNNLEFRIAMKVAKSINEKPKTSRSRPFGSSVPLGPDNEAECVRVELPPASSSNALPAAKKLEKISVFTGDEENEGPILANTPPTSYHPLKELEQIEAEDENMIHPTKWNAAGTEMPEPVFGNLEKVEVYVSDGEEQYEIPESKKALSKTVLAERKPEEVAGFVEVKINISPPIAVAQTALPVRSGKREETFTICSKLGSDSVSAKSIAEPNLPDEFKVPAPKKPSDKSSSLIHSGQGNGVPNISGPNTATAMAQNVAASTMPTTLNSLQPKFEEFVQKALNENQPRLPAVAPAEENLFKMKQIFKCRKHQLERNGRDISFENLRAEEFLKMFPLPKSEQVSPSKKDIPKENNPVLCKNGEDVLSLKQELISLREEFCRYKSETELEIRNCKQEICDLRKEVSELTLSLENAYNIWSGVLASMKTLKDDVEIMRVSTDSGNVCNGSKTGTPNGSNSLTKLQIHSRIPMPEIYQNPNTTKHENDENMTVDVVCKRQLLKYSELSGTIREPFTAIETFQDAEGMVSNISIDVIPSSELNPISKECNFNVTNLTHALNSHPKPMHSSSPEKKPTGGGDPDEDEMDFGIFSNLPGPFTPYTKRNNFNQTVQEAQNLSTIQETSKETSSDSRASGSSSSGSMTAHSSRNSSTILLARSASKSGNPSR